MEKVLIIDLLFSSAKIQTFCDMTKKASPSSRKKMPIRKKVVFLQIENSDAMRRTDIIGEKTRLALFSRNAMHYSVVGEGLLTFKMKATRFFNVSYSQEGEDEDGHFTVNIITKMTRN